METQLKSYLLESGNGKSSVKVRSAEEETLLTIKSEFYLNDSDALDSQATLVLPISQNMFLEKLSTALCSIHEHILENKSSPLKLSLIENGLYLEIVDDSSLIQSIGKRWCAILLNALPKHEMKYIIQLDVTVIESFLENLKRDGIGSESM